VDYTTIAIAAIIAVVIIIVVLLLKDKDRFKIGARGPGGWQADVEAGNNPQSSGKGIRAKHITARTGDVDATDHGGNGIDAEDLDAGGSVRLTSGTPEGPPDPKA
jgi:hypothetical protein